MSVFVRFHTPGFTEEMYQGVAAQATDASKAAPGFIAHYAFLDGDGMTVSEIWDTQAEQEAFFSEHILPKLPQEIPAAQVFEIINTITP